MLHDRLTEPLFPGGIDALPDEHGRIIKRHGMGIGRNHRPVPGYHRYRSQPAHFLRQGAQVFRRRTAASAADAHTLPHKLCGLCRERVRIHIIHGPALFHAREPGIGFEQNRHRSGLQIPAHHRRERFRTQGAVHPDGIRMHALQHGDHGLRGRTGHELAVCAIGIGHEYRQVTGFPDSQESRLGFQCVIHGLDHAQVHTRAHADLHGLFKQRHGFLEPEIAPGPEHAPGRANVQCDIPRLCAAGRLRSLPGTPDSRRDDGFQLLLGKMQEVRPEGIRVYHMAARIIVRLLQAHDDLRVGQVPCLRLFTGTQTFRLQECAHAAVQQQHMVLHILKKIRFHTILSDTYSLAFRTRHTGALSQAHCSLLSGRVWP